MENLTPLQTLALAGLLQPVNGLQSFSSSAALLTAISRFGLAPFTTVSQRCLNVNGPMVINAVRNLPNCLTGYISQSYRINVPDSYGINNNNLITSVLQQSLNISKNGSLGLVKVMRDCYNFSLNSYQTYSLMSNTQQAELPKNTTGFLYNNMSDFATVGISNQFGNPSSEGFKQLCDNLIGFGSMFDISNLESAFTIQSMIQNLFRQGFTEEISKVLNRDRIYVSKLASTQSTLLIAAIKKLPKMVVKAILEQTKYSNGSGQPINFLTEVLDPKVAFGPKALTLIGDFDNLSKKSVAVFGQSTTMTYVNELGTTLKSIKVSELNHLLSLDSNPDDFKRAYSISNLNGLGTGSGVYHNPTMSDMLGSYSGIAYVDLINNISDSQILISESVEGKALLSALTQAYDNNRTLEMDSELATTIETASRAVLVSKTNSVVKGLNQGQDCFIRILDRLVKEKKNLIDAKIDLESIQGTINDAVAFVRDLSTLNTDTEQIGYGEFVRAVCANNLYGEAIKTAINEGFNQILLNNLGVEVKNTLTTSQLTGPQNGDSAQCCP